MTTNSNQKTKMISVRLKPKVIKKIDDMVEKYSRMNKREFTRSDIVKQAIEIYIHNYYCIWRKPKVKKEKEIKNEDQHIC